MGNTSNIAAGKPKITGAIFVAKTGTELPTDAKTELNKEFKQMGYISDNGLENENKIDSDKVKAWGGDTVMTLQKEKTDKFGYELLEVLNVDVIKFVYGENNVSGTLKTGIDILANSEEPETRTVVVDMIMGKALKRIVIPSAKLSDLEKITYKDTEPVGYKVTVTAFPYEFKDKKTGTHREYVVEKTVQEESGA